MALALPTEKTFQDILRDPQARPARGFAWVFITSLISSVVGVIVMSFRLPTLLESLIAAAPGLGLGDARDVMGGVLIGMLVSSPIMAGLAVLGVVIMAALYQFVAKFMIGEGTFGEMAYALCAFGAPFYLISPLFSVPIPLINFIGFLLSLYGLYLTLVAIKAVNRLTWGPTCATAAAIPILVVLCSCGASMLFYSMAERAGSSIFLTPLP